jgi:hypothetical protein
MNDLENRLRDRLHDLADTVPPSPHACADLDRRITRRTTRRPMLATAAAAVVLAGVLVPVALSQSGDQAPRRGATPRPSATDTWSPTTTTKLPNGDLTGWIELGRFDHDGVEMAAVLEVTAMTDGEHWCVDVDYPPGYSATLPGYCDIVPTWPAENPPDALVLTHAVLSDGQALYSDPTPNLMLFITSPQVTSLEVREAYGKPVTVTQVAKTPGAAFYLADFPETHAGFGYTAKDAAGNVLETAIT